MRKLQLLIKEIQDRYVQDNFRRIKLFLDDFENTVTGNINNNIVNVIEDNSIWEGVEDIVNASSSKIIDSIPFATFKAARHIITIYNKANNVYKTFDVASSKKGGDVRDSVYNKVGGSIDYQINVNLNAGNVEFEIVNNESFNLNVSIGKLVH